MLFEWDAAKAQVNLKKHGVAFELAQTVFDDPLHLSVLETMVRHEERWVTVGMSVALETLLVVHTYRDGGIGETTRIISARQATKRERKQYEEGI